MCKEQVNEASEPARQPFDYNGRQLMFKVGSRESVFTFALLFWPALALPVMLDLLS
jgi:hypothetical protein